MVDIPSRRFCAHIDFSESLAKPALPSSPPPSIPTLHTSNFTETSDSDDSDQDLNFDFPQPPSISPALRRMRSSPWSLEQLEALTRKPDRRHSVSPLVHTHLHPQRSSDVTARQRLRHASSLNQFPKRDQELEMIGETLVGLVPPTRREEHPLDVCGPQVSYSQREPSFPRRLERLPPPVPAPSIPLPRLPRIIRKVASMRSDSKHTSMEPERKSLPKIKSLKFLSGYGGFGGNVPHPPKTDVRKRSWSLTRPASFSGPRMIPTSGPSYIDLDSNMGNNLQHPTAYNWSTYAPRMLHYGEEYASPAVYSNPCLAGNSFHGPEDIGSVGADALFDLSRRATLAHHFTQRGISSATSSGGTHRYYNSSFNPRAGYPDSIENITLGYGVSPGISDSIASHNRSDSGMLQPSHSMLDIMGNGKTRNTSSRRRLRAPTSFMDITPERRKSIRSKSRIKDIDPSSSEIEGRRPQMSTSMKIQGGKMKRLLARASSGFVDWGRQLAGRSSKAALTSSASGSSATQHTHT